MASQDDVQVEKREIGISVDREGITFVQPSGDTKVITIKDCCEEGTLPALIFGCFMGIQDIARATRDNNEILKAAVEMGQKASEGGTGANDEMITRVMDAVQAMPDMPEGMENIMSMVNAIVRPKK